MTRKKERKNVEIKFQVGQKVRNKLTGRIGLIVAIWIDLQGIKFSVLFFDDPDNLCRHWFKAEQIEAV